MTEREDQELREKVLARLNEDPTISAEDIVVKAHDGQVILEGSVESRDDRKWIEALVRQIPEVDDVINYLHLGPLGGAAREGERPSL